MNWFDILKMPAKGSGVQIKNNAQYQSASLKDRLNWHQSQKRAWKNQRNALLSESGWALNEIEHSNHPLFQEATEYKENEKFHNRQITRIRRKLKGQTNVPQDYFSIKLEAGNFRKIKSRQDIQDNPIPYVEVDIETYNEQPDNWKIKYHKAMKHYAERDNKKEVVSFHSSMESRLTKTPSQRYGKLETYPSLTSAPKHWKTKYRIPLTREEYYNSDDKTKQDYHSSMRHRGENRTIMAFHERMKERLRLKSPKPNYYSLEEEPIPYLETKEQYDNFDNDDKRKYHNRMITKYRKEGNEELKRFHSKMYDRLRRNTSLPVYFSPEHQQEEQ